jgi:hypothetical protein
VLLGAEAGRGSARRGEDFLVALGRAFVLIRGLTAADARWSGVNLWRAKAFKDTRDTKVEKLLGITDWFLFHPQIPGTF